MDDDLLAELEAELDAEIAAQPAAPSSVAIVALSAARPIPFPLPTSTVAPRGPETMPPAAIVPHSSAQAPMSLSTVPPLPAPQPGIISLEEFTRLQAELMQVKADKYEGVNRERRLQDQLAAQQSRLPTVGVPSTTRDRGPVGSVAKPGAFLANVFQSRPASAASAPAGANGGKGRASGQAAGVEAAAEIVALRRKVVQLEAEVALHKRTKDQLARDFAAAQTDLHDQRASFKKSFATLSVAAAAAVAARSSETVEQYSSDVSSASINEDTAAASPLMSVPADVHELVVVKCSRLEQRLTEQEAETTRLREQLSALSKIRDQFGGELERMKAHAAQQAQTLAARQVEAVESARQLRDLSTSLKFTQGKLEDVQHTRDAAAADHTRAQQRVAELQRDSVRAKEDYKRMLHTLEGDARAHSASAATQAAECERLRVALQASQHSSRQTQASLDVAVTEGQKLRETLHETTARLHTTLQILADSRQALAQMEEQVRDAHDIRENLAVQVDQRKALEGENAMLVAAENRSAAKLVLAREALHAAELVSAAHASAASAARDKQLLAERASSDVSAELAICRVRLDGVERHCAELAATNDACCVERSALGFALSAAQANCDRLSTALADHAATAQQRWEDHTVSAAAELEVVKQALQDSEVQRALDAQKHAKSIKEMAKQLQQAQKTTAQMCSVGGLPNLPSATQALARGASPLPPSTADVTAPARPLQESPPAPAGPTVIPLAVPPIAPAVRPRASHTMALPVHDVDKLADRVRFYESHTQTLTEDIQKKSKIIQQFLLRQEAGQLHTVRATPSPTLERRSPGLLGSMSSRSGGAVVPPALAAEINARLQTVIEDTLSKNIQLQESVDLLGREIVRLSSELADLKPQRILASN